MTPVPPARPVFLDRLFGGVLAGLLVGCKVAFAAVVLTALVATLPVTAVLVVSGRVRIQQILSIVAERARQHVQNALPQPLPAFATA